MCIRTGLSKVGLPGADQGMQAEDPTIAELLKPLGYATGQFGKNHLGDRDEHLPTMHGFDEFFGNLYHLNAEEEPEHPDYPQPTSSPSSGRNTGRVACCTAGRTGDGGAEAIEDTGPLTKKRMETIDDEIVAARSTSSSASTPTGRRSSCGSTPPTCTSGRIPSRRASGRRDAGSRPTTTP